MEEGKKARNFRLPTADPKLDWPKLVLAKIGRAKSRYGIEQSRLFRFGAFFFFWEEGERVGF